MTIKDVEKLKEAFRPAWLATALDLTTTQGLDAKIKNKSNLSLFQIENLKKKLKELNLEYKD